jgi:hypothetical protein
MNQIDKPTQKNNKHHTTEMGLRMTQIYVCLEEWNDERDKQRNNIQKKTSNSNFGKGENREGK